MLKSSQLLWTTIRSLFQSPSYGRTLETYINSRNPQNNADIERYTREFEIKCSSNLKGGALW